MDAIEHVMPERGDMVSISHTARAFVKLPGLEHDPAGPNYIRFQPGVVSIVVEKRLHMSRYSGTGWWLRCLSGDALAWVLALDAENVS